MRRRIEPAAAAAAVVQSRTVEPRRRRTSQPNTATTTTSWIAGATLSTMTAGPKSPGRAGVSYQSQPSGIVWVGRSYAEQVPNITSLLGSISQRPGASSGQVGTVIGSV